MLLNTPNILTLIRIILIPVFVVVFFLPIKWTNIICAIIFLLAAITDWFDGYLARKLGQTSSFGAFLDPVADKLMVTTALVLIVTSNPAAYIAIPAAVIIGREITISALREWMAELGSRAKVSVTYIGKIKTTFQMMAIVFIIYKEPLQGLPVLECGYVLLYAAVILTLWSMLVYLKAAWPIITNDINNINDSA